MAYAVINQGGSPGTSHIIPAKAGFKARLIGANICINANGSLQLQSSGGRALTGPMDLFKGNQLQLGKETTAGEEAWTESDAGEGIDLVSVSGGGNGLAVYMYVPN